VYRGERREERERVKLFGERVVEEREEMQEIHCIVVKL